MGTRGQISSPGNWVLILTITIFPPLKIHNKCSLLFILYSLSNKAMLKVLVKRLVTIRLDLLWLGFNMYFATLKIFTSMGLWWGFQEPVKREKASSLCEVYELWCHYNKFWAALIWFDCRDEILRSCCSPVNCS